MRTSVGTCMALATGVMIAAASICPGASAAPIFNYPWPDYSVLPILFSPTDWDVRSREVRAEARALRTAMREIQTFFARELDGKTFKLNNLEVVQGEHPKEHYDLRWNGRNIYEDGVEFVGNHEAALVAELHARGFPTPPAQNEDGYVALIFMKGAGGWAAARTLALGDGGWGILGDWAIDSIQGQLLEGDYWWSGRRLQIGAAAHELGHTFGLDHPDAYGGDWTTTVMGYWWDYPNVGLNPFERDKLFANKSQFFTVSRPGRVPEPPSAWLLLLPLLALSARRLWRPGVARIFQGA